MQGEETTGIRVSFLRLSSKRQHIFPQMGNTLCVDLPLERGLCYYWETGEIIVVDRE